MKIEDVVGAWALESWVQAFDDGRRQHPFGERPIGRLIYTADGHMSGLIAAADRPRLGGGQWTSPPEEAAAAYASFLAYGGTFDIVGEEIVHHVEVSLFPNWTGLDQRRRASLADGLLSLAGRVEEGTANARTVTLTWRRIA